MGRIQSWANTSQNLIAETDIEQDEHCLSLENYELYDSRKSAVFPKENLDKSNVSSSTIEKLRKSFPRSQIYCTFTSILKWKVNSTIQDAELWILQDWGDGIDEEIYSTAAIQKPFPKDLIDKNNAVGECTNMGTLSVKSNGFLETKYDAPMPIDLPNRVFYLFVLNGDNQLLVKSKVFVMFNDAAENAREDLMTMSLYERKNREEKLEETLQLKADESDFKPPGIFNREELRKLTESLQNIVRPQIQFIISSDEISLSYRKYEPVSKEFDACVIFVAQNSFFQDMAASRLSNSFNVVSYVVEVRGFGYSGGPRGQVKTKDLIWKDVRSFVRLAKFSHPESPIFLAGNLYTGGLLINYDIWKEKEPVTGYILLAPMLGRQAMEVWKMDTFNKCEKEHAVRRYHRNLVISHFTRGLLRGQTLAFEYNFADELYAVNPMTVDHITTTAFFSFTPDDPKHQLQHFSRPVYFLIGENDEFFVPELVKKYGTLPRKEGSKFEIVGSCSNISVLTDTTQLLGKWVHQISRSSFSRKKGHGNPIDKLSQSRNHNLVSSVDEAMLKMGNSISIILKEYNLDAKESLYSAANSSISTTLKSNFKVPTYDFIEAVDGAKLAYQIYKPTGIATGVLLFWLDAYKSEFLHDLCEALQIYIYRFDLRDTGLSISGPGSTKYVLWQDLKLSVLFCKKNYPGYVIFLGGHGITASLVLNYATWRAAEPANAYIFISPLANPFSGINDCLVLSPTKDIFARRYKKNWFGGGAQRSKWIIESLKGKKSTISFSEAFIKATLAKDLMTQLLTLQVPFGIWYGDHDELIRGNFVVDSVCSLARAPMHISDIIPGARHIGALQSFADSLKPWIGRVSTALNPQPNRRLFDQVHAGDFEKVELVGKGTFGHVWLVRHKATSKYLAMKILHKSDILKADLVAQVIRERDILKSTINSFVVPFAGSFQDSKNIYLLMEFLVGGELYTLLRIHTRLNTDWVRFYAAEILLALASLHDVGIIYRDLKPENILFDALGHIRLIDFGLSRQLTEDQLCSTFCGSPFYMAPEMIANKSYGFSVDIWAFAVVVFELLNGTLPFTGRTPSEIYRKILFGKIAWPSSMDPDAKDMISHILQLDPEKRLGLIPIKTTSSTDSTVSETNVDRSGSTISGTGSSGQAIGNISLLPNNDSKVNRYSAIMRHKFFKGIDWGLLQMRALVPPFQPTVGSEGDTSNFIKYSYDPRSSSPAVPPVEISRGDPFANF